MVKIWLVFMLFGKAVASMGPMAAGDCEAERLQDTAKMNIVFATLPANAPALRVGVRFMGPGDVEFRCWSGAEPPALNEDWTQ